MNSPSTPHHFATEIDVSRETLQRLQIYHDLLLRWNSRVSLVGKSTLVDIWRRHFLDSAQLVHCLPKKPKVWVDIGSGAGFPGMVLAILNAGTVHLVESNQRKCAFLREVARMTQTNVEIHNERVEHLDPWPSDVITARAVAPVAKLLEISRSFVTANSTCLFLKGQDIDDELTEARKYWKMSIDFTPSVADYRGTILRLTRISHV